MTLVDRRDAGLADPRAAVAALFEQHYARMLRVAAVLLGDVPSAEEVVQDAFLKLYAAWPRIRDKSDPAGYLHRSVVNAARSRLRRRAVAARLHPVSARPSGPSAEDAALAEQLRGPLVRALATLPPREREVVLLRYYLDRSEQQTADALGLSRGSVKAYASRGLAALRGTLTDLSELEGTGP